MCFRATWILWSIYEITPVFSQFQTSMLRVHKAVIMIHDNDGIVVKSIFDNLLVKVP